jgi:RNA polymerase sigma factor (sigma-70 family)
MIDLERALASLPDHQRLVVVLHDVEGFTHEEIGAQLGLATGTSKATLSRARCALRQALTRGVSNAER